MAKTAAAKPKAGGYRDLTFGVCLIERGQLMKHARVDRQIKYADFLAEIHGLTTDIAHLLPDLPVSLEVGEGFSLRDGPWWYRLVHLGQPDQYVYDDKSGWAANRRQFFKGDWMVLNNAAAFKKMVHDFHAAQEQTDSWIELQHQLQFDRDGPEFLNTPYRRRPPVIVDGSKAPPQVSSPPNKRIATQPMMLASQPAPALPVGATQPKPDHRSLPVQPRQKTASVALLPKKPKFGVFQPPKPRQANQSDLNRSYQFPIRAPLSNALPHVSKNTRGGSLRDSSFITNPYENKNMRGNNHRSASFVTNPWASSQFGEGCNAPDDGPGPAVEASPAITSLNLGSPAFLPQSEHRSMPWSHGPVPTSAYGSSNNVKYSSAMSWVIDQGYAPHSLDPALELNQTSTTRVHRQGITKWTPNGSAYDALRLPAIQSTNPGEELQWGQSASAARGNNTLKEAATFGDEPRPQKDQPKKHKGPYRRGGKKDHTVDSKTAEERAKTIEYLNKQRDERQLRAQRRAGLKD